MNISLTYGSQGVDLRVNLETENLERIVKVKLEIRNLEEFVKDGRDERRSDLISACCMMV